MQKVSSNTPEWNNLKKMMLFVMISIFLSIVLLNVSQYTDNFGYLIPRPLSLLLTFFWLFLLIPLSIVGFVAILVVILKQGQSVSNISFLFLAFCLLFFIVSVSVFLRSRQESIFLGKLGENVVREIESYKKQNGSYPKGLHLVSDAFPPDEQKVLQNQFDYTMMKSDSGEGFSLNYEFRSFSWLQGCAFSSEGNPSTWNCYPD